MNDPEVVEGGVGELRAAGALAEGPHAGRAGLEPLVDRDEAARVALDAGHVEADAVGVGRAPRRHQQLARFDRALAAARAHQGAQRAPPAVHPQQRGAQHDLGAFVEEQVQERVGDVRVLAAEELRPTLDDGDAAAEAPIGLRELQPDIPAAEDNQVLGHAIELQHLDVRDRRAGEAGKRRDERAGPQVEEDAVARQQAGTAIVETHLDRLGGDEAPFAQEQLDAGLAIALQVEGDLRLHHLALACEHVGHVHAGAGHVPVPTRGRLRQPARKARGGADHGREQVGERTVPSAPSLAATPATIRRDANPGRPGPRSYPRRRGNTGWRAPDAVAARGAGADAKEKR